MRIKNLPSIESMDGSQDALVIEQTDGSEDKSRKVSPSQIKQYVLGNSIDDIYSVMGEMGAKNLIPYPYYETTHTESGVTFTDNGDGTVTANTGGSAATGNATFFCGNPNNVSNLIKLDKNKTYIFSDTTHSGIANNCIVGIRYFAEGVVPSTTSGTNANCNLSNNWQVTVTNAVYAYIYIYVYSGKTVSNLTFKPLLRLAADTDNTYQPYAKTNKELTDELDTAREQIAALENIKVANVSATMNVATADSKAIGGYRSVSSTSKALSTFTGYPTGKTVVATSLFAYGENAAILGVVHVINGVVYLNTATTGDYIVHGNVFYKD